MIPSTIKKLQYMILLIFLPQSSSKSGINGRYIFLCCINHYFLTDNDGSNDQGINDQWLTNLSEEVEQSFAMVFVISPILYNTPTNTPSFCRLRKCCDHGWSLFHLLYFRYTTHYCTL